MHILLFFQFNHCYPDRIVVYRDGVGDGRFAYVVDHEIPAIKKAFLGVTMPDGTPYTYVFFFL